MISIDIYGYLCGCSYKVCGYLLICMDNYMGVRMIFRQVLMDVAQSQDMSRQLWCLGACLDQQISRQKDKLAHWLVQDLVNPQGPRFALQFEIFQDNKLVYKQSSLGFTRCFLIKLHGWPKMIKHRGFSIGCSAKPMKKHNFPTT